MINFKRTFFGVVFGLFIAGTATGETRGYSGTLCNPMSPTDAARLSYSQFGIYNTSSVAAIAQCGGANQLFSDVIEISAVVYDRNPSSDVCCTFMLLNDDGNTVSSGVKCSTVGTGAQTIRFTVLGSHGGYVNMACIVPPSTTTGFSHVASYLVTSFSS